MPTDSYGWLPHSLAAWIRQEWKVPEEAVRTPFTPLAHAIRKTRLRW